MEGPEGTYQAVGRSQRCECLEQCIMPKPDVHVCRYIGRAKNLDDVKLLILLLPGIQLLDKRSHFNVKAGWHVLEENTNRI